MVGPIPFMKSGFQYGASTAREEALIRAQTKQEEQTKMIREHSGGGGDITVPQIHTGAASDAQLNKNIAEANKVYMDQREASKFDKLAVSNSITKGGRKRKAKKSKRKSVKKSKKTRRNKRKN